VFGRERVDFPLEVVPLPDQFPADAFEVLDVLGRGEFGGGLLALGGMIVSPELFESPFFFFGRFADWKGFVFLGWDIVIACIAKECFYLLF
jgi:hypothetical protein